MPSLDLDKQTSKIQPTRIFGPKSLFQVPFPLFNDHQINIPLEVVGEANMLKIPQLERKKFDLIWILQWVSSEKFQSHLVSKCFIPKSHPSPNDPTNRSFPSLNPMAS